MTTKNILKTVFLLVLLTAIMILIGRFIGGSKGMLIAFGISMIMNLFSYWFSDKLVLSMYKAQEVTESSEPRLYNIVRNLATKANLPMPKVYIVMSGSPNAFATGRNKKHAAVAVTNSLMNLLDDNELEGVLAHELAHIKGNDILIGTIVAMMAGFIMLAIDFFKWGAILGGNSDGESNDNSLGSVGTILMLILAPFAAMLIQMGISRSREYIADQRGAELCGKPGALAQALEKIAYGVSETQMQNATQATAHMFIMNPFSGKNIMALFSTHPPVEDRIEKLRAMERNKLSLSGRPIKGNPIFS